MQTEGEGHVVRIYRTRASLLEGKLRNNGITLSGVVLGIVWSWRFICRCAQYDSFRRF
ncbi:hypothetical protein VAE151_500084 [Vibrio aestuarianus]|uniref:Uncharacterized protein n=1 Tax=Vibrio aestuarianus TaxID=28171 RepID=A0ABM9FLM7_9VIBR|nr:hypothetical protein VAE130_530084 [Vibrio aestuarianus]CAH8187005.1 hypothetical protein VAE142_850084 [Vibrio aestuarianus]CAH8189016.1 hypothetical protein VAE016_330084 [Vibrio aestuarianus]CAH8190798.1 hypothetical protein VAE151_500084 [Vibrio aestuarianus]CAH8210077.1 hypothetical protein VAE063_880082 [Vibrio aestuarianus]